MIYLEALREEIEIYIKLYTITLLSTFYEAAWITISEYD